MSALAEPAPAARGRGRGRGAPDPALERALVTPEGVPVRMRVARAGDRVLAFVADFALLLLARVGLWIGIALLAAALGAAIGFDAASPVVALGLLLDFVVRHLWFAGFELRWGGRTPGKRWLKLRVVDRRGGALAVEAVVVRNLLRELEVWLPLTALVVPDALWPAEAGLARVVAVVWLLVLAAVPLFNRDRLRLGDLAAGTLVVREPEARLLRDLIDARSEGDAVGGRGSVRGRTGDPARRPPGEGAPSAPRYAFATAELEVYGIYELQALEALLRAGRASERALATAADKIRRKIGWRGPREVDAERFLRDFYTAQRAHLERRLAAGERKERRDG